MKLDPALVAVLLDFGKGIAKAVWNAVTDKDDNKESLEAIAKAARDGAIDAAISEAKRRAAELGITMAVDAFDAAGQNLLRAIREAEKAPNFLEGASIEIVDELPTTATTIRIVDQPPPIASDHRPSWELVIEDVSRIFEAGGNAPPEARRLYESLLSDMGERHRLGIERYGQPLQAGNGRRHLVDAYQELLDETVYLRTWLEEKGVSILGDSPPEDLHAQVIVVMYFEAIQRIGTMRELIENGL